MTLALNTSHPLYGNLVALICVDDDNVIKDLMAAQTCTPNAAVTVGTGTYGRHFRTTFASTNALGVTLAPGIVTKPIANPHATTFVVVNANNSVVSRGSIFNAAVTAPWSPAISGQVAAVVSGSGTPISPGTTDILVSGAHSFGAAITGTTASKVFANGAIEATGTGIGNANDTAKATYIGGNPSGGFGGLAADYVWVAHFNKYLTDTEIADLHASIGADNTFALIASSDVTAPTLTGVITASAITQTTYTLSWPAGADNVAVAAYEYNLNGGAFVSTGTATMVNITGRTAGSTDAATVRAKDAAGNVSTPVLSTTVNLLAAVIPGITTPVLKNNTGTVLASETGVVVNVYNASTGALVLQKTGLTSNASGIVTFTDATLSAATSYAYEVVLSGGRRRLPLVTTA